MSFMEVLGCCCPFLCKVQCQEKSEGVPNVAWSFFMSVDSVYHGYSKIEKLINCTSKKREK